MTRRAVDISGGEYRMKRIAKALVNSLRRPLLRQVAAHQQSGAGERAEVAARSIELRLLGQSPASPSADAQDARAFSRSQYVLLLRSAPGAPRPTGTRGSFPTTQYSPH